MDFDYTEEQLMLKKTVREFAEKELAPQVHDYERHGPLNREQTISFIKQLMPFGFYNGHMTEEYGGSNLSALTYAIINEELARVWAGLAGLIWIAGSRPPNDVPDSERNEVRDMIRAGETISAGAISEPDHGSDASYMSTTAVEDGDDYVITGTKTWISNGPVADRITVHASLKPGGGRDTIRTFRMNRKNHPWQVVRNNELFGLKAWANGELRFDDVRVPRTHMNDPKASAGAQGKRVWNFQSPRTMLATFATGIAQASVDAAIRYSQDRVQFGRPIASFQLVQGMIYEMVAETEAARFLTYRAIAMQDKGEDSTWQAALAKGFATEVAHRVASHCVEIHGALGLLEGYPVERYFRDGRALSIPDGTTEIQKLVVGRRLTGISAIQ